MRTLKRLKKLAGLNENSDPHLMSSDEMDDYDDSQDDARHLREHKIVGLIAKALSRIGFSLSLDDDLPIMYSEDDREATVRLDDSSIDLDQLLRLKKTGLSANYRVEVNGDGTLDIVFTVSSALDNASI